MTEAFVYLWQDARQKPYKYYLGYHKGTPDDSYTHSSRVFESFSKDNVPNGVRRRILATGSTEEMMELENKLLNNRKDSKWDRYYNVMTNFPPNMWEDPEYRKMHSEKAKKQWEDPKFREKTIAKISKRTKKLWQDPEYRKWKTDNTKKQWDDPKFRKMHSEKMSEQAKKLWQDPEFRKMQSDKAQKLWQDPKFRKMKSDQMKEKWNDPKFRKMKSEQVKKQWEDPEYRKRQIEKLSERSKKQWKDPEYRAKHSVKVTCNVCGFVGARITIARWHNDNCKHKDTTTLENFLTD